MVCKDCKKNQWISVKEKSPEGDYCVLVLSIKGWMGTTKACYDKNSDVFIYDNPDCRARLLLDVSHWMEIPAFPVKE